MENESDGGTDSKRQTLRDGSTQSQAIGKVMESVTNYYEPGQGLDPPQPTQHSSPPPLNLARERERERDRERERESEQRERERERE